MSDTDFRMGDEGTWLLLGGNWALFWDMELDLLGAKVLCWINSKSDYLHIDLKLNCAITNDATEQKLA